MTGFSFSDLKMFSFLDLECSFSFLELEINYRLISTNECPVFKQSGVNHMLFIVNCNTIN